MIMSVSLPKPSYKLVAFKWCRIMNRQSVASLAASSAPHLSGAILWAESRLLLWPILLHRISCYLVKRVNFGKIYVSCKACFDSTITISEPNNIYTMQSKTFIYYKNSFVFYKIAKFFWKFLNPIREQQDTIVNLCRLSCKLSDFSQE